MLVAQEQLLFVRRMVATFETYTSTMLLIVAVQSEYIAIVVMLRAVGHTFESVDCDTPEKVRWGKDAWKSWQKEPIFADFITPTRDTLLKEFRGGLTLTNEAFGSIAIVANAGMPGGIEMRAGFDPERLTSSDGNPVMPKIRQALAFWDRRLGEAEAAFNKFAK